MQTEVCRHERRYPALKFVPTIRTTVSCRPLKRTHCFVRRKNTERDIKVQKRPGPPYLKTGSSFHHPTELSHVWPWGSDFKFKARPDTKLWDGTGTWEKNGRDSPHIQSQQRLFSETPPFKINSNSKYDYKWVERGTHMFFIKSMASLTSVFISEVEVGVDFPDK